MSIGSYLPSAKLISIVLSLALSVGLVFAADALTRREPPQVSVATDTGSTSGVDAGWEAALSAIQAQNASSSFPTPDPNFVDNLLQAAQSSNVTESVSRTLLINITNAKSQGLGDDIPTQDQIIAAATAQLKNQATPSGYSAANLTVVTPSKSSLRDYGNGVMKIMTTSSSASESAALVVIDVAVETHNDAQLKVLSTIGDAYGELARSLAGVPVPQTLEPLHLQVVNNYIQISASFDDMRTIISDPLRGLVALQQYESLLDQQARLLTNIAQELSKDGILFTKDEPGATWSIFLAPTAAPASPQ